MNPALGLRAIRFCLRSPEVFKAQVRGILRASAFGKIAVMFPFISGLEEVLAAKRVLKDAMEELDKEGVKFDPKIPVGIMIEVPGAALTADRLALEVDFFSIGTNDLIQYTLAIDRINEYVSYLYEPLHPAVLRMIKRTVDDAHAANVEVSICGEMAGEPRYAPILLGLDLDELSMNAYIIPRVKKIIRGLSHSYCKDLVKEVLTNDSAIESEHFLEKEMTAMFPDDFAKSSAKS
jgi:phosphotransferase system enzyme I (PtsI)